MKIALVAPIDETVPPRTYGGIERIVHLLDRELVRRGHEVILLASGGSRSLGRLVPVSDAPLRAEGRDMGAHELIRRKDAAARLAASVLADARPDVVLNHSWRLLDHLNSRSPRMLTTVHYPLDTGHYRSIFLARPHATYISISWSQQRALGLLRFAGNVYNGVDLEELPFCPQPGGYLAFLGRASPDKGLDIAIRTAQRIGLPLRVAAKIDGSQQRWFDEVVVPLTRRGGVEFVGEVDTAGRAAFLGGASALLHPSRWSEPFGLASVEAMACGTPVIALRKGAADEVIADGRTGFVVGEEEDLASATVRASELDRAACRAHVEKRFSHTCMAAGYESLAREEGP
jgi:glycosyltransferase involved in cell wall biosynthesis